MARRPLPDRILIAARVRRGQDGMWSIVRELDAKGPWSVPMVEAETNARRGNVCRYVHLLARTGVAFPSRQTGRTKYGRPIKFYRLAPAWGRKEAPRFRAGKAIRATAQEQLWTAMRTLRQFTTKEIAFVASTDELKIEEATARRYVEQLNGVGYMAALSAPGGGRNTTWRLKPSHNTGPLAPAILVTATVFDRNRNAVMGQPIAAEAA